MRRLGRRWTVVAALALTASLLCAAPSSASRKATPKERRALTGAVHASPVADIDDVPRKRYRVTGQRVSAVSRFWAIARMAPRPRFESTFQPAYVIAVRLAGTDQWVVVDAGTSQVGCGIVSDRVIADLLGLKRVANACPSGEGIG